MPAVSLFARWLDLDQDGDLDLYVVNYCAAEHAERHSPGQGEPPPGVANSVFRNDGEPAADSANTIHARTPVATAHEPRPGAKGLSIALVPWPGAEALLGRAKPHTGITVLDVDDDRDLDLVLDGRQEPAGGLAQ